MASAFQNSSLIANESLRRLKNNMRFLGTINRQYNSEFKARGTQPGVTVNLRKPVRVSGRTGAEAQPQGIRDNLVPLTINKQYGVDIELTSQELALNLQSYSEQVVQPAMERIANDIDMDGLAEAIMACNYVGLPNATPSSMQTYLDAGSLLTDNQVPTGANRYCLFSPTMDATLTYNVRDLQNDAASIGEQYRMGRMRRRALGFTFETVHNLPVHTVGALGSTPLVNGANQTGSSLVIDGCSNSVTGYFKKGDIITCGVKRANASSGVNTNLLMQFVVTADTDSDGSGNATVPIYPPITTSGPYKTCVSSPSDNAAILTFGHASSYAGLASKQGFAYDKDFCTFVNVDLMVPDDVHMGGRASSEDLGLSVRHIRFYDGYKDKWIDRFDVLGGWKVHRPELCVRIMSVY